jgi:U6 snRNA-associated Sm-like protein LSm6
MSTGGADKSGSGGGAAPVKTPSDFLKSIRGRPVVVKLNSGVDYRGSSPSLSFLQDQP